MNYCIIIPARKGSKGIKNKNRQLIDNKPMIAYTFDAAVTANITSEIYLTSDDLEVIKLAKKNNDIKTPFLRPKELSEDNSGMAEVVLHLLEWIYNDYGSYPVNFILLQPTSPLRDGDDIKKAVVKFEESGKESLFSACKVSQHPFEMFHIKENGVLDFFYKQHEATQSKNRQAYREVYFEDGSIYICNAKWFLESKSFIDNKSAIYKIEQNHALDIDTEYDLNIARSLSINY